jgi:hypothetical protein
VDLATSGLGTASRPSVLTPLYGGRPGEEALWAALLRGKSPRLDLADGRSWRARPIQGDINATWGKPLMDLTSKERPNGFWPVFKGESFDLWTPDTGTYYAWAEPEKMLAHLQKTRLRAGRSRNSPFSEFDSRVLRESKTLPCLRPRIAFRDVTKGS